MYFLEVSEKLFLIIAFNNHGIHVQLYGREPNLIEELEQGEDINLCLQMYFKSVVKGKWPSEVYPSDDCCDHVVGAVIVCSKVTVESGAELLVNQEFLRMTDETSKVSLGLS